MHQDSTVPSMRKLPAWSWIAPLVVVAACRGGTEPQPPGPAAQIVPASDTLRTVVVGMPLSDSLAVRVVDASGRGVPGQVVSWSDWSGGTISPTESLTDASGRARAALRVGNRAGEYSVTGQAVTTSGPQAVRFRATASPGPAAAITIVPEGRTVGVDDTLHLSARRVDRFGNGITDRPVVWSSSRPSVASVDAQTGVVRGVAPGSADITATSEGVGASVRIMVARLISGADRFDTNSLDAYASFSDDGGAPWTISGGELIGSGFAVHNVLIRKNLSVLDGWVETTTRQADDGGLVLRFQDNSNYYLLAIRDDTSPFPRPYQNFKIYKRSDRAFLELWEADVSWSRGTDRTVRFEMIGSRLNVYLDGARIGSVDDRSPLGRGGFGLRHYGGFQSWTVRYQDLRWQLLGS